MSCCASSLYESRPYGLPAPCRVRHQASSIVTSPTGTALISAPQRGVKGPRKGTKKCARGSGQGQSAGELRSPLSRYGFAFAPDSTPLVGLRPPDPP
jgi:hypothetical protein